MGKAARAWKGITTIISAQDLSDPADPIGDISLGAMGYFGCHIQAAFDFTTTPSDRGYISIYGSADGTTVDTVPLVSRMVDSTGGDANVSFVLTDAYYLHIECSLDSTTTDGGSVTVKYDAWDVSTS